MCVRGGLVHVGEGWCTSRGLVRVGWDGDVKVGAGAYERKAGHVGGGWCVSGGLVRVRWDGDVKVEAGAHGRRAVHRRVVHINGGQHTKVGASIRRWRPAHEGRCRRTKVGAGAQR